MNRKRTGVSTASRAAMAVLLLAAGLASAAAINVRLVTDKGIYNAGDTVHWTIYAWASKGDNRGIALLAADVDDDTTDVVQLPAINGADFAQTAYGTPQKFIRMADPVISVTPPDLRGILLMQLPNDRKLDIGNDGSANHILAQGSYTIMQHGWHTLSVPLIANYWADSVSLTSEAFETVNNSPARIRVGLAADINADYDVNMLDYSILAAWWGSAQCDITPYCDGADITGDGAVDLSDAAVIAAQWLQSDKPEQYALQADINRDHYVNLADFSTLAAWWAADNCDTGCQGADITQDNRINWPDAAAMAAQWLQCDDPANPTCTAAN